ncbi:hypothetical protein [Glacieibacterium sp.]|uniref:hypothetical protein n=1 Tax=Glacieibacterium sp. TaxID=2860237 RepID=UPI003B00C021
MMARLYWGAGIALVVWLLPPTISSGGGLAGSRHVDSSIYGATAAGRMALDRSDAQVAAALGRALP